MATIKYLLQGESLNNPIYLRLSLNKFKSLKRKTGLLINKNNWSIKTGFPKQNTAVNKNLTTELKDLSNFIIKSINNSSKSIEELNGDWLNHQIDLYFGRVNTKEKSIILIDVIQEIINDAPYRTNAKGGKGLSKSRINAYKSLKNKIIHYQKNHKTLISEVNLNFAKDFLNYLLEEKKHSENTARKLIADLKTVCYNAELNGLKVSNQIKKIESTKIKNDNILYLSKEEIKSIRDLTIDSKSLENARKWLLLGCQIGQRGSDLLKITESNFVVSDGYHLIELEQQKTGKLVTIPVLEDTKEIINTGLPYKIAIQKFNRYIKIICELAEIKNLVKGSKTIVTTDKRGNSISRKETGVYPKWELMSSHVCRRSFATNLYGELPTPFIMQVTAHSSEKMFLQYIGKSSLDYAKQIADFYNKKN
jgi:integrase